LALPGANQVIFTDLVVQLIDFNRKDRAKRYHKSSIFNSGLSGLGIGAAHIDEDFVSR
jgi:hypothetical protein